MSLWTCRDPACRALNKSAAMECESCSTPRRSGVATSEKPGAKPCDQCGTTQGQRLLFDLETLVAADRNAWLCSSCRGHAIQRRYDADQRVNGDRCPEPGCGKSVREHIAETRRAIARVLEPPSARSPRALDAAPPRPVL